MDIRPLIARKQAGATLTGEEIRTLIARLCAGEVAEAQLAAWLMAVWFRGMSEAETVALTLAMAASGEQLDLRQVGGRLVVDKHSTGGVGDKTTLVVAPLVAACGVPVAKMSGRALGHTGGTIDKLEIIPGLRTALEPDQIRAQVARIGLVIAAQGERLVPADKLLYALRDRIGAVDSLPLIASSVMSKKIAAGAGGIVLDVKAGSGAFMRTTRQAGGLARLMVRVGVGAGRRMHALVTDMSRPLGRAIGDRAELAEAIAALRGEGPADLVELSLVLGERMLALAGEADPAAARARLQQALATGQGLEKLAAMVRAQGGDERVIREPGRLSAPPVAAVVSARQAGYLRRIEPRALGQAVRDLKEAGHRQAELLLCAQVGEQVAAGAALAEIRGLPAGAAAAVLARLERAFRIGPQPPPARPLVLAEVPG